MDTKWRNLIIVLVLIIVIALGYIYLTQNPIIPSTPVQSEDDKEYLVLANLFTLSDVNVLLFRENSLLQEDSNNFRLAYSKEKLSSLATDLNDVRVWSKDQLTPQKYAKFSSLIDIYQAEIKTNVTFYDFTSEFTSITNANQSAINSSDESVYCGYVGKYYPDFTVKLSDISDLMVDLSAKNFNHFQDYNVLVIDYDFATSQYNMNQFWTGIYDDLNYCDQKGLIK